MAFGVHLSGEVGIFLVGYVAIFREECHSLDWECQDGLETFGVEPFHEAFLEPVERVPVRLAAVREVEVAEEALEIIFVVVGDVPEHRLVVTCASWLVDGVNYLFEAVGDDLVEGAFSCREVDHFVSASVVVFSVFHLYEIVEIHQEFRCGAGAAQHRRHHKHHVDEAAAERLKVGRACCVASDRLGAFEEPRIHGD